MTMHIPTGVHVTVPTLSTLGRTLRSRTMPVATTLFWTQVATLVAEHIDQVRAGLPGTLHAGRHTTAGAQAHTLTRQRVIDSTADTTYRNPWYDLGVTVTILPHPDTDTWLGIIRGEHTTYHDTIRELPGITDYAWYSCEHPPVPDDQWQARHDTWTRALRDGRYSDTGWTWSLFPTGVPAIPDHTHTWDPAAAARALPPADVRAKRLALHLGAAALSNARPDGSFPFYDLLDAADNHIDQARQLIAPLHDDDWDTPLPPR